MQLNTTVLKLSSIYTGQRNKKGELCDIYSPFLNLADELTKALSDFTTTKFNFDMEHPVDILIQDATDGAVNLIINDDKNIPKLINSRFSVLEDQTFHVPDHNGSKDTTIYDESTFDIDTAIKATPTGIPKVEFLGLLDNAGKLPCGVYSFYFKLADADGNETEVVAESGLVYCHIGTTNKPETIRLGMEDENSGKAIVFKLTDIDYGFDFVRVYYARSSSGNDEHPSTLYYAILNEYSINSGECTICITGTELLAGLGAKELFTDYADIYAAKTQTIHNNVLMLGNIKELEHDWNAIKEFTWKIIAKEVVLPPGSVGSLNLDHKDVLFTDSEVTGCYYNAKNIYYRVGYWPGEIYRFGIVYIFEDNSLSPVINLQGLDFNLVNNPTIADLLEKTPDGYTSWKAETDDHYFNKAIRSNSRGVYRLKETRKVYNFLGGVVTPTPLGIMFDFSKIHYTDNESPSGTTWKEVLSKHKIKGYFIVRQKRIPNIIAQGLIIGHMTKDFGSIPTLMLGNKYCVYPFLDKHRMISEKAELAEIASREGRITKTAMLVPDAEMREPLFNDLFVSNRYLLKPSILFQTLYDKLTNTQIMFGANSSLALGETVTLTNVPDGTKMITDGLNYFSTMAGESTDPIKTINVEHAWNKTMPQTLTTSRSYVRGLFGPYVGLNENNSIKYGCLCNIYLDGWNDKETALDIAFDKNMISGELFHAISDRMLIEKQLTCFRGDCFITMFTHRMHRNFIDHEYPTNHTVIDPACWGKNFAVRATAYNLISNDGTGGASFNNCQKEDEGWYLEGQLNLNTEVPIYNQIADTFEINTARYISGFKTDMNQLGDDPHIIDANKYRFDWDKTLGKYVPNFTSDVKGKWVACESPSLKPVYPKDVLVGAKPSSGAWFEHIYLKHPEPKKTGMALIDTVVTLTDASINEYTPRGSSNINRGDINAVAIGQWITFPLCSNINLSMRDIDRSNAGEEALFNRKRGFFPLNAKLADVPLRDSNIINGAAKMSVPHKFYVSLPDMPYFKLEFFNRVYTSKVDNYSTYANSFKVLLESSYKDYPKEYGTITKLVSVGNVVYIIFTHGIGKVSLGLSEDKTSVIQSDMVVLSDTYGSMWKDSIMLTPRGIYGVDTVAKVIWSIIDDRINIISDKTVNKFLIDNIDLSEFTFKPYVGHINVKTHYNAYKHDVIFTYYNDTPYHIETDENNVLELYDVDDFGRVVDKDNNVVDGVTATNLKVKYNTLNQDWDSYSDLNINYWKKGKQWSLCWNEDLLVFLTFYDWIPLESENIDNIFFSFDKDGIFNYDRVSDIRFPNIITSSGEEYPCVMTNKQAIDSSFNHLCNYWLLDPKNTYSITIPENKACVLYIEGTDSKDWKLSYKNYESIFVDNGINCYVIDGAGPQYTINLRPDNDNAGFLKVYDVKYMDSLKQTDRSLVIIPSLKFNVENYIYRKSGNPMLLWKHGLAGLYDKQGIIKPTNWYGKQHEFNFEFVVTELSPILKIFNNLKIISNKTQPDKFEYEIVGESYSWWEYKKLIHWINSQPIPNWVSDPDFWWKYILTMDNNQELQNITLINPHTLESCVYLNYPGFKRHISKLPYLKIETIDRKGRKDKSYNETDNWDQLIPNDTKKYDYSFNTSETVIKYDPQLNEYRIHDEQLGNNMTEYGRVRGNMQYLEDFWNIEIRPLVFQWCYMQDGYFKKQKITESRHRDKYLKVKVRYSGLDLAVILGIITMFDESFA